MKELDLNVIKGNYRDVVKFFESDDCMELTESERFILFMLSFDEIKTILDDKPVNWLYLSDYIKICGLFADAYVKDQDD